MSNSKILTHNMMHLPIDVFIEDSDLDFYRARKVADARASKISKEPMLLAWYDRKSGEFSPRVE
jgi:hypothetical protein